MREPERPPTIAPLWMILYLMATLIVGVSATAVVYRFNIGGHAAQPFPILPLLVVGEFVIYLVMLIVPGERVVPPRRAMLGIACGMVVRAGIAFFATSAIRFSKPSADPGQLMMQLYASYWAAGLVQILLAVLYLWIIRTALEIDRLKPPVARAHEQSEAQLREEEAASEERRRRLLTALLDQREGADDQQLEALPGAAHSIPPAVREQLEREARAAEEAEVAAEEARQAEAESQEPVDEPPAATGTRFYIPVAQVPTEPEPQPADDAQPEPSVQPVAPPPPLDDPEARQRRLRERLASLHAASSATTTAPAETEQAPVAEPEAEELPEPEPVPASQAEPEFVNEPTAEPVLIVEAVPEPPAEAEGPSPYAPTPEAIAEVELPTAPADAPALASVEPEPQAVAEPEPAIASWVAEPDGDEEQEPPVEPEAAPAPAPEQQPEPAAVLGQPADTAAFVPIETVAEPEPEPAVPPQLSFDEPEPAAVAEPQLAEVVPEPSTSASDAPEPPVEAIEPGPVAEPVATDKPAVQEPAAEEPVAEETVVNEPVVDPRITALSARLGDLAPGLVPSVWLTEGQPLVAALTAHPATVGAPDVAASVRATVTACAAARAGSVETALAMADSDTFGLASAPGVGGIGYVVAELSEIGNLGLAARTLKQYRASLADAELPSHAFPASPAPGAGQASEAGPAENLPAMATAAVAADGRLVPCQARQTVLVAPAHADPGEVAVAAEQLLDAWRRLHPHTNRLLLTGDGGGLVVAELAEGVLVALVATSPAEVAAHHVQLKKLATTLGVEA